jgi:hypothetical protein
VRGLRRKDLVRAFLRCQLLETFDNIIVASGEQSVQRSSIDEIANRALDRRLVAP